MTDATISLRAVLFDLDDTLLYNDMENKFLKHYFALLTAYAAPDIAPQTLIAAVMSGTDAVQRNEDPTLTNEQVFAAVFAPQLGKPWAELKPFFTRFYEERFLELRVHTRPHPAARQTVQACIDGGYRVAIATNPLFPARAIEHRLHWAGLDGLPFALVTTYENMHTCKPSPRYYAEIAGYLDLAPAECVMVGNDVLRDIAPAQRAGMRTYLADRWLANEDSDVHPDGQGSLADLLPWLGLHP
jgi:FMN phosphatase YigB (HAD superfamily)